MQALKFNQQLMPILWDGDSLKSGIKDHVLHVVDQFIDEAGLDTLDLLDVVITGSSAGFNWTYQSDIDVHIVFDHEAAKVTVHDNIGDVIDSKVQMWNEKHNITFGGHKIELYLQDPEEEFHGSGIYSLFHNKWLSKASNQPPIIDEQDFKDNFNKYKQQVLDSIHSGELKQIQKTWDAIKEYRQSGLRTQAEEFSVPNLVFKELRREGLIDRLSKHRLELTDRQLTIV